MRKITMPGSGLNEDRAFEKTEDLIKRGFLLSRDILRPYINS